MAGLIDIRLWLATVGNFITLKPVTTKNAKFMFITIYNATLLFLSDVPCQAIHLPLLHIVLVGLGLFHCQGKSKNKEINQKVSRNFKSLPFRVITL